jgi:membrane protease YdiL (CAAX protease family)
MLTRAPLAWLAILFLAILNGALRQAFLLPALGDRDARIISTLLLCVFVSLAAWRLVPWIRPADGRAAWGIGLLWLLLTLAFEFLAGHYLFGDSWESLLAEYNLVKGRIWMLVLITVLAAPVVVHTLRHRVE